MGNLKVCSLFCGCGGIDLAFQQAGCGIVYAIDINKYACKLYNANFAHSAVCGDIAQTVPADIPDFDILTAGFPCQPFTVAGQKQGFDDSRGLLYKHAIRIAEQKKPKAIFLENVRGLVTMQQGAVLQAICNDLAAIGYNVKYAVLNAINYGTCQNRQRLFIVAFRDNACLKTFAFPEEHQQTCALDDFFCRKQKQAEKYYYRPGKNKKFKFESAILQTVTDSRFTYKVHKSDIRKYKENTIPTLLHNMGGGGHNVPLVLDCFGVRKITPRECFRLQGFDDSFILPADISDTQLYGIAGNSVFVPLVKKIAENITAVLDKV